MVWEINFPITTVIHQHPKYHLLAIYRLGIFLILGAGGTLIIMPTMVA
jgi:hypothetical protein